MGLLDGVRVLDLTQMLAGPLATMWLGDLGAEVVKVEHPDGELTRDLEPVVDGMSYYFAAVNRNKECITLDLRTDRGRSLCIELAAEVDVVVESFKAGTPEQFGINYDSVASEHPEVVYASIRGFGEGSPYESAPAFDMVAQAISGAMSLTGEADGPPVRCNVPIGDVAASTTVVQSVLAALYARDVNDAGGTRIEVSMLDALISWLGPRAAHSLVTGEPYPRTGSRHREFAPYDRFETADGDLVVAVAAESLWPKFCRAVDREEWIDDPRFATNEARLAHREELTDALAVLFDGRTADEWFETLREYGVPAGPVHDTSELWDDPHVRERDLVHRLHSEGVGEALPSLRYPARFAGGLCDPTPAQGLGAATEEYLAALGYDEDEIRALHEDGVL